MPKFGVSLSNFTTTTAVKTALKLVTATKVPVEVIELHGYGAGLAAPADVQHQMTAAFVSAAGAGTGAASPPTPEKFAQSSAVSGSTILWAMTAEPTTYATVFPVLISFNQRGGMRYAVPQGEGLKNQFENTNMHMGWRVQSSVAGAIDGAMHWWEW